MITPQPHDARPDNVVVKTVTVACDVNMAFRVWTEQIHAWWPAGHSMSGDPNTQVFIEGGVGGRIYERASDNAEFDWGEIVAWEPPHYFAHTWHIGSHQGPPSRVDVRFIEVGEASTQVQIEHRGPEYIGELWSLNQTRYSVGWGKVLPGYVAACG